MSSYQAETGKEVVFWLKEINFTVRLKIFFLTLLLFLTDQFSKLFVKGFYLPWFGIQHTGLNPGETKPIINNLFSITLVENPGIAFGIIPGAILRELILILTISLCIGLTIYLLKSKNGNKQMRISIGLILAGAAGNLFDRIFYGYFFDYGPLFRGKVVDFLDIRFLKFFVFSNRPGNYIFNFADLSIVTGIIFLIYLIMRVKNQTTENLPVKNLIEERQDQL